MWQLTTSAVTLTNVLIRKTFELIRVTVSQSKPLVTSDEIADSLENGTPIVVEFDEAMVKVYMPRDAKTFAESITAKCHYNRKAGFKKIWDGDICHHLLTKERRQFLWKNCLNS